MACWDIFTSNASQMSSFANSSCFDYGLIRFKKLPIMMDPNIAGFQLDSTNRSLAKDVFRRLREKQLVGAPLVMIQTRRVVNDTGLPVLEIDQAAQTIAIDWKGMFTQLLGEEHVFNTISSQGLGWRLDPRAALANVHEAHRRIARKSINSSMIMPRNQVYIIHAISSATLRVFSLLFHVFKNQH